MDEVENPSLPAAGESSPTLTPVDDDEDSAIEIGSPPKPPIDETSNVPEGTTERRTPSSPGRLQLPTRPPMRREGSAPPPQQPPPAPPSETPLDSPQDQPDSLTLADLRRIRNQPAPVAPLKLELLDCDTVYDFQYQDAESLPVELEEWFTYSWDERRRLQKCKLAFEEAWRSTTPEGEAGTGWMDVTEDVRRAFVSKRVEVLAKREGDVSMALYVLTYVGLGIWETTGGREETFKLQDLFVAEYGGHYRLADYTSSGLQLRWIVAMIDTLRACDGLSAIFLALRKACDEALEPRPGEQSFRNEPLPRRPDESDQLWCSLTLMYLFIEVARTASGENGKKLKADIMSLEPNLLNFLTQTVGKLRWDEGAPVPLTKMLLLSWKAILVTIGGLKDVENVKASLREDKLDEEKDQAGQPVITASPLDYHLFRQEISSKYPAYQAPPPLFPLEPENNSILPPLKHRRPSYAWTDSAYTGTPSVGTDSIMHQPIHIATPAPSPPPSPGGPGKAGKKQNYQTNQMFPFMYPPLDLLSNELGGKGGTQLQDALVGRKWDGSDIPASILEAAELFSKRMRATRAMKQLWEVRVDFMKYERGWKATDEMYDEVYDEQGKDVKLLPKKNADIAPAGANAEAGQTEEQRQLAAVANFYRDSLPHLQSVVIVLLKAVLQHVTDIVSRGNGQNGLQPGIQFNEPNGTNGSVKPMENGTDADDLAGTAEELDRLRTQEIASKAISAILILLLKWFKVSHILQYEYMTQLLLDSNYVPLLLKLWQTLDIGRACHFRLEREELNFFHFCEEFSQKGAAKSAESQKAHTDAAANSVPHPDDDEAVPPPIRLQRDVSDHPLSPTSTPPDFSHPPEVDELGYPQTPMPTSPITTYSYRNVFSSVNFLRALQKVTRRKTHRALLLVSYKSSNHLKRSLKVPIRPLRYYTLKLFKSQVPFCGRKWRQGNMKIITAVWLSVPAELRDDWLSGGGGGMGGACVGDVDGTVEDALPLEQSIRALTHWWNVRNYPDVMGIDRNMVEEEMDYFKRELEKMEGFEMARDLGEGELEGDGFVEDGVGGGSMVPGAPWSGQGPIEGY